MIKKKDPYIALLDFYYERFPESLTLSETYEFFNKKGYISNDELQIIKAFGKEREKVAQELEKAAETKRVYFEKIFIRAGDSIASHQSRNSPRILNSEHYFHRLGYIELIEAQKASKIALIISLVAILISAGSLAHALKSSDKPVIISESQVNRIVAAINTLPQEHSNENNNVSTSKK
jgi:hypothetical protein